MKNQYFNYNGISLNKSDIIRLIKKCFDRVLGFSPATTAINSIYTFPNDICAVIAFKVNEIKYELNISVEPYTSSVLTLVTDDFGGSNPTLGIIFDWETRDYLDEIIQK